MSIPEQIEAYISSQPEVKRSDMALLHQQLMTLLPGTKLWFEDGKDSTGKMVSNPNIGYGSYTIRYSDGKTREFFQVGMSANTTGISIYVMGIPDKTYLANTYSATIGKASVTGYCIKFKKLKHIDLEVLKHAIRFGVAVTAD